MFISETDRMVSLGRKFFTLQTLCLLGFALIVLTSVVLIRASCRVMLRIMAQVGC